VDGIDDPTMPVTIQWQVETVRGIVYNTELMVDRRAFHFGIKSHHIIHHPPVQAIAVDVYQDEMNMLKIPGHAQDAFKTTA
jgi:hypothetical protein